MCWTWHACICFLWARQFVFIILYVCTAGQTPTDLVLHNFPLLFFCLFLNTLGAFLVWLAFLLSYICITNLKTSSVVLLFGFFFSLWDSSDRYLCHWVNLYSPLQSGTIRYQLLSNETEWYGSYTLGDRALWCLSFTMVWEVSLHWSVGAILFISW